MDLTSPPLPRLKDGQGRIVIPVGSLKFYAGENVYYACVRQAVPHTDRYTIYLFYCEFYFNSQIVGVRMLKGCFSVAFESCEKYTDRVIPKRSFM